MDIGIAHGAYTAPAGPASPGPGTDRDGVSLSPLVRYTWGRAHPRPNGPTAIPYNKETRGRPPHHTQPDPP